jgi:hypothetical protein
MALSVLTTNEGRRRITTDDRNPRLYMEEWLCHGGCETWIEQSEAIWARPNGQLSTMAMDAEPYCDGCLPEEV